MVWRLRDGRPFFGKSFTGLASVLDVGALGTTDIAKATTQDEQQFLHDFRPKKFWLKASALSHS